MLASLTEDYDGAFRCPRTANALRLNRDRLVAGSFTRGTACSYPIVSGLPVLVDFDRSVLDRETTMRRVAKSMVERPEYTGLSAFVKQLLSPQKSTTRGNIRKILAMLDQSDRDWKVLVVGGGSIGQGMRPLYEHPKVKIFAFDIYSSRNVQFVADAHNIPLADELFDAVIVQAVLEHVLQPDKVVSEIWRVLKPDGIVYAETPFMQQVHEGAYDFTRFTQSGHRYLFRRFGEIASGPSGGPGLQLMWTADYFCRSLFRSKRMGKIAKALVFWAQYLDDLIPPAYASDAASGVYFLGSKSTREITPREIIAYYAGAQHG
ncbi:MAG: class I SAM-dependent methyltransferase [Methylobacterium mesophilicum]|nr:class I SAM-dependent methyltransferase [Methylobacterium mesophilicum]